MRAVFPARSKRLVLGVPQQAVVVEGTSSLVFRAEGKGFARAVVEVGEQHDDWVEVRHGLKAGDIVARRGQAALEQARQ